MKPTINNSVQKIPSNGFIDVLERELIKLNVEKRSDIWEAFQDLKCAANEINPLFTAIDERFKARRGLTINELTIVCSYPLFRAIPTLKEISAVFNLLVHADLRDEAKKLFPNMTDELGGPRLQNFLDKILCRQPTNYEGHETWLYQNIYHFSQDHLHFEHFEPQSYALMLEALQYEAKQGRFPDLETLINIGSKTSTYLVSNVANKKQYIRKAAIEVERLSRLIPHDAHLYTQRIQEITAEEARDPKSIKHLCAATTRLAIRESSNVTRTTKAENTGVAGIFLKVIDHYKGYMTKKAYDRIGGWANAHIDKSEGVEQVHEEQANEIALGFITELLESDPAQLADVFRQEAEHCRVRTAQAASFAEAMDKSRQVPGYTAQKIVTIGHDLNTASGEVPIKPDGHLVDRRTYSERFTASGLNTLQYSHA